MWNTANFIEPPKFLRRSDCVEQETKAFFLIEQPIRPSSSPLVARRFMCGEGRTHHTWRSLARPAQRTATAPPISLFLSLLLLFLRTLEVSLTFMTSYDVEWTVTFGICDLSPYLVLMKIRLFLSDKSNFALARSPSIKSYRRNSAKHLISAIRLCRAELHSGVRVRPPWSLPPSSFSRTVVCLQHSFPLFSRRSG